MPNPIGEGYICPAFDPVSSRCNIYESRPLDCRLYPLALMWDAVHQHVMLGWDTKCPFMVESPPPTIAAHAARVKALLATDGMIDTIAANPRLIGRFQEDVVVLEELPRLTARLGVHVDARLRPLTPDDVPQFTQALERARIVSANALAAHAVAYHYMWTSVLPYWWMEVGDTFFLFAQSPDGFFMPLLPLGVKPLTQSVAEAFEYLRQWNGHSPVSRIENVMGRHKQELEQAGYRCASKGGDYLYEARALAALAGDQYKSQRALCNRIEREQVVEIRAYRETDSAGCGALYERWATYKHAEDTDPLGRLLLEDGRGAHRLVIAESDRLQLSGTVAIRRDTVVAYTFGYWLTPATFCVLVEVADRSIPGLSQFLFRHTCRNAVDRGARYVNAMDDAGLPGLRDAKRAYRPIELIDNWVIMDH